MSPLEYENIYEKKKKDTEAVERVYMKTAFSIPDIKEDKKAVLRVQRRPIKLVHRVRDSA